MALIVADRVQETTTTTGTGSISLGGAVTGYQAFSSVLSTGDTTYYTIADQTGSNWEVGLGTFTSPSTLARTTILSSSNAGSVVTFTAGTKNVFITYPASRSVLSNSSGVVPPAAGGTGASTLTTNNVLLGNGTSAVQFVAPGTSGNVLTSDGTTWASSAAPKSGWVFLSLISPTSAATADIETTFDSTYDVYAIVAEFVQLSAATTLICRFKLGGAYSSAANYAYATMQNQGNSTAPAGAGSVAATQIQLNSFSPSTTTAYSTNFICYVYPPWATSTWKTISFAGQSFNSTSVGNFNGSGTFTTNVTQTLTGVRFLGTTGNISGAFRLYGIKNS